MVSGYIKVITGPMSSSKTLEVILLARELEQAGNKVVAFHPADSSRWDSNAIVSRLTVPVGSEDVVRLSFPSTPIHDLAADFFQLCPENADVVIFDDAQFFSANIVEIAKSLRRKGVGVIVSGLDMDCFQQPFGAMPFLMAIADEVTKKTTFCKDCGGLGQISYRLTDSKEQMVIGDEEYITLCYKCWYDRKDEEEMDF